METSAVYPLGLLELQLVSLTTAERCPLTRMSAMGREHAFAIGAERPDPDERHGGLRSSKAAGRWAIIQAPDRRNERRGLQGPDGWYAEESRRRQHNE
jgi:hypothetical protein